MRKESTTNQGFDENLICRSLEFFATQKIGMTLLFCLLSATAHAECVPTPDCASIGYTATSCDGDSLKCPFDTTKLFCVHCGPAYKYDCNGENITGGVEASCGGKYVSCLCSGNMIFNNGSCQQNCTVGMIYYSDKSCSSTYDSSKTAIGVVVKDNELVLSQRSSFTMTWGTPGKELSLNNLTSDQAKEDFNGKSNTATIIAEDTGAVAAKYCNDYTTAGTSAGDWYLPAAGELYSYVYGNLSAINTAMTSIGWTWGTYYLWSSSLAGNLFAWEVLPYSGHISGYTRDSDDPYVCCFLEIN